MNEALYKFLLPWISLLVTGCISWLFYKHFICALQGKYKVRKLIKKKQKERENSFIKLENRYKNLVDDGKFEKILALSENELLENLHNRKLSASEVLDAFMTKALKTTRELNCVTEFVPQAHMWAAKLDEMSEIKGPLHGLPVSIKENIDIEGTDSTRGFGQNIHKPLEESAVIVKVLLEMGAVPFCKTNVPQTLFTWACGNPIFGETKNCHNPKLSPGGSSGGEGSLIGSGSSIIGIGTDIGGSARIPAHFCGIAGFKPTRLRLSSKGIRPAVPGMVGLTGGTGLLSKNAKIITRMFKLLTEGETQRKYDTSLLPIPWNEQMFSSKKEFRIGYFTSLPYFPVLGDTEKIVLAAKEDLEKDGHTLVPFQMPDQYILMKLFADFAYADDGKIYRKLWKDEPVAQAAIFHYMMSHIPRCIRAILANILECKWLPTFYTPTYAAVIRGGVNKSADLWDRLGLRAQLMYEITSQWTNLNLDFLLSPVFPFPAVPIKAAGILKPAIVYTMPWNMFDFPAGTVKYGEESGGNFDKYDNKGDILLRWADKAVRDCKGMPIGVQIVGLPFQDELVLRGMELLESIYNDKQK